MKFVKTFNWTIFNWDQICKIDYIDQDDRYYDYFTLKNGDKIDVADLPDHFYIDTEDQHYYFYPECIVKYNEILINRIEKYFSEGGCIYDVESYEDEIWEEFIEWARKNKNKLTPYRKR